jgi:eukaryotic-like serine/threonine-protein kinase
VIGEARLKRLSAVLPASGITVTKFALTSWTVKCVDRATGEELYYNTAMPKGAGTWTSEEEALRHIGAKMADEFSRNFFLQHFNIPGQKITLKVEGLPETAAPLLANELVGLPTVMTAQLRPASSPPLFDVQLAAAGDPGELIVNDILKPLNAKLGEACFSLGGTSGSEVSLSVERTCNQTAVARLETAPPAALYSAPPARLRSIVKNPETLRQLPANSGA